LRQLFFGLISLWHSSKVSELSCVAFGIIGPASKQHHLTGKPLWTKDIKPMDLIRDNRTLFHPLATLKRKKK